MHFILLTWGGGGVGRQTQLADGFSHDTGVKVNGIYYRRRHDGQWQFRHTHESWVDYEVVRRGYPTDSAVEMYLACDFNLLQRTPKPPRPVRPVASAATNAGPATPAASAKRKADDTVTPTPASKRSYK